MTRVGAYQAKTHLPRLLDEVESGATITITRNGRPVARLMPVADPMDAVARMLELRKVIGKRGRKMSMRALIEEGRR